MADRRSLLPWRRLAKNAPTNTPAPIQEALTAQGMNTTGALGPGRPINPVEGYSTRPRAMDYPVASNVSIVPRATWGRTSFETLGAIIDAYDVARMCINYKIDELRSMELMFLPLDGRKGHDIDDAIAAARAALAFPDRQNTYEEWLSLALENALRYDALPLYRRRNRAGDVIGLEVIDGPTIQPRIDDHGRRPKAPAPAFDQVIKGQVWTWFTSQDLIYARFRPQSNSPYGLAPIESILLTANTDLRFQWHFLQMFTDGSIPGGFINAPPDASSPDQVAEWQDYWDAMVMGDQAKLHQLIVVPNGTSVSETKPKTFDHEFPEYLMSRTCAQFGVLPQDLGLVKDVNRANGETQVDIQFRTHTLPWVLWWQRILSNYLQHDLGLPVQAKLDTGRDKEDRLEEAQAHKIYVEIGAESPDDVRSEVLGLPVDDERPIPRFIIANKTAIPLSTLVQQSGQTDPNTGTPLVEVPGQPAPAPAQPLAKDLTAGVTADTGITGVDLRDDDDPDWVKAETDPVRKAELRQQHRYATDRAAAERFAFTRFAKARRASGKWRDFTFAAVDPREAHRLNDSGRAAVRKAAGDLVAAGLVVRAGDTGRVLMLQRALDPDDDAAGTWEFPGGHLETDESPLAAACREWQEETGLLLPVDVVGALVGQPPAWVAGEPAVYAGFVVTVPCEAMFDLAARTQVTNPDDPDGDQVEAIAWWNPADLAGLPNLRAELRANLGQISPALQPDPAGEPPTAQLPLAKATNPGDPRWWAHPTRHAEDALANAHQDAMNAALGGLLTRDVLEQIARDYLASDRG